MEMNEQGPKLNKAIMIAGVFNILGMVTIIISMVNFTPFTMVFSITVGGILLGLSLVIYLIEVLYDLRVRKIL